MLLFLLPLGRYIHTLPPLTDSNFKQALCRYFDLTITEVEIRGQYHSQSANKYICAAAISSQNMAGATAM